MIVRSCHRDCQNFVPCRRINWEVWIRCVTVVPYSSDKNDIQTIGITKYIMERFSTSCKTHTEYIYTVLNGVFYSFGGITIYTTQRHYFAIPADPSNTDGIVAARCGSACCACPMIPSVIRPRIVVVFRKIPADKIVWIVISVIIMIVYIAGIKLPLAADIFQHVTISVGVFAEVLPHALSKIFVRPLNLFEVRYHDIFGSCFDVPRFWGIHIVIVLLLMVPLPVKIGVVWYDCRALEIQWYLCLCI